MKNRRFILFAVVALFTTAMMNISCSQQTDLKALIVTGQNNHNWVSSSVRLRTILAKSGVFSVDIEISPEQGKDMSGFIVDFTPYDVVVLDYTGDAWPSETNENFLS